MSILKYRPYQAKTILNKLKTPDEYYHCTYTLNPYRGCEHGCAYCYVQSEKYIPYKKEKKDEFFRRVEVKTNAPFLLQAELRKIKEPAIICLGSACDPYQPAEEKHRMTYRILEILLDAGFPVHILTKSDLVLRDVDLLKKIDEKSLAIVTFSVVTLKPALIRIFEPNAPHPKKRLLAMKKVRKEGILSGVSLMPVLPYLVDLPDLSETIKSASRQGAAYVLYGDLTLRDKQRDRFLSILEEKFPRYLHRYKALYKDRPGPQATYTQRIEEEINNLCIKHKILTRIPIPEERLHKSIKQGELW